VTEWLRWHDDCTNERSPLSRRLRIVRSHIAASLDERLEERLTVISACAGQGHDLLGCSRSARTGAGCGCGPG